jgi:soluble lytic murein transglycosylase-like protein
VALLALLLVFAVAMLPTPVPVESVKPSTPLVLKTPDDIAQPILSAHLSSKYKQPLDQTAVIVAASFREGRALGLPPELILGIIASESSFKRWRKAAMARRVLCRWVPRFHGKLLAEHANNNPLSIEGNIRVGARILKEYLESSNGDLQKALARYSGGARNYHGKVTKHWLEYQKITGLPSNEVLACKELYLYC